MGMNLQERQAREYDICPVREELYSQTFNELIRQITIESPERGLLLLRVRDEVRMTIAAYQTLYASSITFGMRKTLRSRSTRRWRPRSRSSARRSSGLHRFCKT